MSDLLPCRFCRFAPHAWLDDYINGRCVTDPEYIIECENGNCSVMPEARGTYPYMDEVRAMWNAANALPAVQPDIRIEDLTAERDKYESAWMTAEGKLADAMEGLEKCQAELDEYSRQEYPLDHSVHERYRQRDYDANPARITLAALKGETP